ncbi:MAG: glucose 1-dehydrogenase [Dehalococcoidales bacterium]|jgi:dihydroanticapsin dehydrogenase|nr:glucose 1-dehydrogenase [Dehalococcoidales bacterium]
MQLKGKVALVTGAAGGIGAAIVRRFVSEGALVCATDCQQEALETLVKSMPAGTVVSCAGDVTSTSDVERMIETAVAFGGKLNVLVNSHGIDPPEGRDKVDPDLWHRIIEVNLTGPFLTIKKTIPHMLKAGGGSIINISSLSGLRYMAGRASYSSSKGGLISLTQQVAVEYGPANIRCNVICPGAIKTPLLENNMRPLAGMLGKEVDWVLEKFTSFSPLRRVGTPEEIAAICSFLASDDSSLLTGGVFIADGGTHLVDVNSSAIASLFMNLQEKEQKLSG